MPHHAQWGRSGKTKTEQPADETKQVLEDAERTQRRTVDASEQVGHTEERQHRPDGKRKHRGPELEVGEAAEERRNGSGEIEQRQRQTEQGDRRDENAQKTKS